MTDGAAEAGDRRADLSAEGTGFKDSTLKLVPLIVIMESTYKGL